jgi:hypothetical protein
LTRGSDYSINHRRRFSFKSHVNRVKCLPMLFSHKRSILEQSYQIELLFFCVLTQFQADCDRVASLLGIFTVLK